MATLLAILGLTAAEGFGATFYNALTEEQRIAAQQKAAELTRKAASARAKAQDAYNALVQILGKQFPDSAKTQALDKIRAMKLDVQQKEDEATKAELEDADNRLNKYDELNPASSLSEVISRQGKKAKEGLSKGLQKLGDAIIKIKDKFVIPGLNYYDNEKKSNNKKEEGKDEAYYK